MRIALVLITLPVAALLLTTGGCPPDGSLGGPPVRPFLPAALTLNVSELPEDADSATAKLSTQCHLDGRDLYDAVVRSAASVVLRFQHLADRALALAAVINEDLTDPNQTQVSGTFDVAGQTVTYKADFAAFDFDGDGTADGSGTARDLPVVVRIWTDRGTGFAPFLCALVTQRPAADNVGAGRLFLRPGAMHGDVPADVQFYVEYDRTDPAHQWNFAYVSGTVHPRHVLTGGVARIDVRTGSAGVEKTVRGAYQFAEDLYGFDTFRAAVHYLEGGAGMLASAEATGGIAQASFTNLCVNLLDRALATDGECADFDLQDMSLLDLPPDGATALPAGFPAQPTF
jgi:hypothetical protein